MFSTIPFSFTFTIPLFSLGKTSPYGNNLVVPGMQRSEPWACGTKFSKRAPRLNDLTFKIFKKKEGGGEGGAPRAVGRLLKRGGRSFL